MVDGDTVPTVGTLSSTSFVGSGPFSVGETTLTLPTKLVELRVPTVGTVSPSTMWVPGIVAA